MNIISQIQIFEAKLQNLVDRYYDICLSEDYYADKRETVGNGENDIFCVGEGKSDKNDYFGNHDDRNVKDKNDMSTTEKTRMENQKENDDSNQMKISHLCSFLLNRIVRNNDAQSIDSDLFVIR